MGIALFSVLALVLSACSTAATPTLADAGGIGPLRRPPDPRRPPGLRTPSAAAGTWKVGVVTDVGTSMTELQPVLVRRRGEGRHGDQRELAARDRRRTRPIRE
jgi:hypothetical protein